MSKITVGIISKPQGVKGELKVLPFTDDENRFKSLKEAYIGGKHYLINGARVAPNGVFLTLNGVSDRNQAEEMRNMVIEIDRTDAIEIDPDKNFIVDVIGSKVIFNVDGEIIGEVKDILQYGAADVYVIKENNGKTSMIPSIKELVLHVDVQTKTVILDKTVYGDLAVYED